MGDILLDEGYFDVWRDSCMSAVPPSLFNAFITDLVCWYAPISLSKTTQNMNVYNFPDEPNFCESATIILSHM